MAQQDIKQLRDKALAEHDQIRKRVDDLKQRLGKEPGNEGLSSELRTLRQEAGIKGSEYGELARMVALQAGGKNYRPPV